jgi:hypothetical protein
MERIFLLAVAIAVAARLAVWFGTMLIPVPNEALQPISPLHANSAIDLPFYLNSRDIYGEWLARFAAAPWREWGQIAQALLDYMRTNFVAAPLMAGLLALFDYRAGNTLPLAVVYLLMSCGLAFTWLRWFKRFPTPSAVFVIFALIPGPLWLMLNVSTDLPFAALFTAFFLVFFSNRRDRDRYGWGIAIALITTLLRPHGISLFLFMGLYAAFLSPGRTRKMKLILLGFLLVAGGALFVLFSAYFQAYLRSSAAISYFGHAQATYLAGIFPGFPAILNQMASWLALGVSKLLYLAGLRPSYGETPLAWVLVRAAPGLILLPGLLYGLLRAPWAYRLLLVAFFAPVAMGAAQDRYLLAVTPLLILFASRAGQEIWGMVTGRHPVFPPLPLENRV